MDLAAMRRDLEALLGPEMVDCRQVADLWPLGLMRARAGESRAPCLVARPADVDGVCRLLGWAARRDLVVVPVGASAGVCGALAVGPDQVALDLGGLDRILEIDDLNLVCRVEAGVSGLRLEDELSARGLTLGHFPASLATSSIGGLVSTRSTGQQSTLYGGIEDLVIGLGLVLPDGTRLAARNIARTAVGPPLHQLWIGAEGGLGVVVEVVLRLHRTPPLVLGGAWATATVEAGLECLRRLVQAGLRPLVLRLYDREDTALQGQVIDGCLLIAAFAGEPEVARAEFGCARRLLAGCADLGEEPWESWLRHRFDLSAARLEAMLSPAGAFLDTIELGSDWKGLPALHSRVRAALGVGGIALCHFSHPTAQGCCAYFTFAGAAASEAEAEASYLRAWREAMAIALETGATISHHHGVGQARAAWARRELGPWWDVWASVRGALDPCQTMNPRALGGLGAPAGRG